MTIETKRVWAIGIGGLMAGIATGLAIAAVFGSFAADTGAATPAPTAAPTAGPIATPGPSGSGTGVGFDPQRALAKVGDVVITESDLASYLYGRHGEESLRSLVDREVVAYEAKRLKLAVTDKEIEDELHRMQQGYESEAQFYRSMREQLGLTREHLQQDVTHRLLTEKIAIASISVKDSEVEEYIRERPEEFESYERYRLQKIIVRTKEQANAVVAQLASGAEFAETAMSLSMDANSARAGGDIGWIDENDPFADPAIIKAAKKLSTGGISGVFEADGGYVVLRLVEKKLENDRTAKQIRDAVRKELQLQRAKPLNEVIAQLREQYAVDLGAVENHFHVDKGK